MLRSKWLFSVLMVLFISIVMIGCSNDKQTTGKEKDEGDKSEEVTLKWLVPSIDQPDQEKVWAKFNEELQEYLPNTTVEFENVTITEYSQRWQLVAAGQEPIDIAWNNSDIPFVQEVDKGAYMDLTDLIPEYAPDIENELSEFMMDFVKIDGRQYAIPNWQPMTDIRLKMVTKKEDFDEFWSVEEVEEVFYSRDGRPFDQTAFDALTEYFQKMKDAGREFEVSPHMIDTMQQGQIIADPFVIRMQDENFEVVNKMELPEMKLFFDNSRDWYEKGFIREDVISNPGGGKSDNVIWFHAYFPGDELANEENQVVPLGENYYISQLTHPSNTVIPSSSKNPERAMQLINLLHSEKGKELFNLLLWGIEGEHYTKVSENRIETIGYNGAFPANPGSEAPYGLTHYFTGNTLNSWETQANPEGHWEKMGELHDKAWKSPLIGFKPDLKTVRTQMAQIQTISTEYWDTLKNGASAKHEELYEQMIQRMNESGAQDIIDELQKQVDEYVAENNL